MPSIIKKCHLMALLLLQPVLSATQTSQQPTYSPCPLIKSYYPPPVITKSSATGKKLASTITGYFKDLVSQNGNDIFGPITPNTTSFTVVLFTGAESQAEDPVFFEYHHTADDDTPQGLGPVTLDSKFPLGDLTMVFTVYAWLVRMGEEWHTAITKFLPELKGSNNDFEIPWEDITVGDLAGHFSGLKRQSDACVIGKPCDYDAFVKKVSGESPVFLPGTTPMVSYTAFQLLAFAMQRSGSNHRGDTRLSEIFSKSILNPLNMTRSGLLGTCGQGLYGEGLNVSYAGDPGAISFVSTAKDLAVAGNAMLSSRLISPAATRRWLQSNADTSNLRNGAGRPWEVYRSASPATGPVIDIFAKPGAIGPYGSYFGLAPDFNAGFAILAHDATYIDRHLDLNVYVDVVSLAIRALASEAAYQAGMNYAGKYRGKHDDEAVFSLTANGPGLAVKTLRLGGIDIRADVAHKLGIEAANLDFRLYPTNVQDEHSHQFVAVFQDEDALVDAGTPTCITWQEVGAAKGVEYIYVFDLGSDGVAKGVRIGSDVHLARE